MNRILKYKEIVLNIPKNVVIFLRTFDLPYNLTKNDSFNIIIILIQNRLPEGAILQV